MPVRLLLSYIVLLQQLSLSSSFFPLSLSLPLFLSSSLPPFHTHTLSLSTECNEANYKLRIALFQPSPEFCCHFFNRVRYNFGLCEQMLEQCSDCASEAMYNDLIAVMHIFHIPPKRFLFKPFSAQIAALKHFFLHRVFNPSFLTEQSRMITSQE